MIVCVYECMIVCVYVCIHVCMSECVYEYVCTYVCLPIIAPSKDHTLTLVPYMLVFYLGVFLADPRRHIHPQPPALDTR